MSNAIIEINFTPATKTEEQKIKFRPATPDGRYRGIVAYTIPDMPGLCVHRCKFESGCSPREKSKWRVSHISSGRALPCLYDTKIEAIIGAKCRHSKINWTKSIEDLVKDGKVKI